MSLLKLDPESERLRRIAKAHAAGEITQEEFRRIRAEVIDRFSDPARRVDFDDATERRWLRSEHDRSVRPTATAVVDARSWQWIRMVGLVLIVCALAVLGAARAFAVPSPEGVPRSLPTVPDRALDDARSMGIDRGPVQVWPFGVPFGEPFSEPFSIPQERPPRAGEADAEGGPLPLQLGAVTRGSIQRFGRAAQLWAEPSA